MKSIYRLLSIAAAAAACLTACDPPADDPFSGGETPETPTRPSNPSETTGPTTQIRQADVFAQNALGIYYLWAKEIDSDLDQLSPSTCTDPVSVVRKIRYHVDNKEVDHWTVLTDDLKSMTNSVEGLGLTFGYDLQAGGISNRTGEYFLIVSYVVKDGPAEKGGLKRGDIIITIDGNAITASNIYDAFNKDKVTLGIAHYIADQNQIGPVEKQVTREAVDMWENPVLVDTTYEVQGKKIGYLVYNSFDIKSMETLPQVFREFKAKGVEELILDLRYNGGGYVNTECELASLIAPYSSVAAGDVFQTEVYNDLLTNAWKDEDFNTYFSTTFEYQGGDYNISEDISDANPGISKLYVIVTGSSASASEGLIVGLLPYMNVTLIGTQTYGKYCAGYMMSPSSFKDIIPNFSYSQIADWGIYVMVSKFADKNGNNPAMPDGIPVNIEAYDDPFDGYQLGDTGESMLKTALSAAGAPDTGTRAAHASRPPFELEMIDHDVPRGVLIKTDLPGRVKASL